MNLESISNALAENAALQETTMRALIGIVKAACFLEEEGLVEIDKNNINADKMLIDLADQFARENFDKCLTDRTLYDFAKPHLLERFGGEQEYRVDLVYRRAGHVYVKAGSEASAREKARQEIAAFGAACIEDDEDIGVDPEDILEIFNTHCIG